MTRGLWLPFAAAMAALAVGQAAPHAQTPEADAFPRPVLPPVTEAPVAPADPLADPVPASIAAPPAAAAPAAPVAPRPPLAAPGAPVSLTADSVSYDAPTRILTAEGGVEVHFGGRVLRAARIVYREDDDVILATGPLSLVDAEAGVIFAESAAVTIDFREGTIASARLLVAGILQLAAAEIRRSEGRYTTLHRTIASTCEICPGEGAPTWAIRADRVIRDEQTRLIHFRNATLEIFGLPIAWLPYMRIPEPGTTRATGVLAPEFRQSSLYGFGVKLPWYQVLGPHADLTLTPFVTQRGGTLLESEFRWLFGRGSLDVSGVVTADDGLEDRSARGTIAARGTYSLGGGFRAELDAAAASDDRFLSQYDYSEADRLTSTLRIVRFGATERFELGAVAFQSLVAGEDRAEIPLILPELRFRTVRPDAIAGGRIGLEADAIGILRGSGRDVVRIGATGDWRRDATFGPGIAAGTQLGAQLDFWGVHGEAGAPDRGEARAVPFARAELRWPLQRVVPGGTEIIEPMADLVWSSALGSDSADIPNEDSLLPEFDETNLFSRDRFPGRDRVETGLRANLGLSYSRYDTAGRAATATFGRVLRFSEREAFGGSGLDGFASDWVGAVEVAIGPTFSALNRIRLDDQFDIARNEFSFAYQTTRAGLAASWYYLAGDVGADLAPQPETSELAFAGRYRFMPNWELHGNWRYDAATDTTLRAGGGISYGNECAELDLGLTRRFATGTDQPAVTSIGFAVRLVGLGSSGTETWPRRACAG